MKWRIWNYDVWYDGTGPYVNNRIDCGVIDLPEKLTTKHIRDVFNELARIADWTDFGDSVVEVESINGYPIGQLVKEYKGV